MSYDNTRDEMKNEMETDNISLDILHCLRGHSSSPFSHLFYSTLLYSKYFNLLCSPPLSCTLIFSPSLFSHLSPICTCFTFWFIPFRPLYFPLFTSCSVRTSRCTYTCTYVRQSQYRHGERAVYDQGRVTHRLQVLSMGNGESYCLSVYLSVSQSMHLTIYLTPNTPPPSIGQFISSCIAYLHANPIDDCKWE